MSQDANAAKSPEMSIDVYRGTQRPDLGGIRRGLSFATSRIVAATYAARPGTSYSDTAFVSGSTFHRARYVGRVLCLGRRAVMDLDEVLKALGYGEANGIVDEEVMRILWYLHNRSTGKAKGGDVAMAVFDEDGEEQSEEDMDIGLFSSSSMAKAFSDWWDFSPSIEMAARFRASTYGFVDAPSVQLAARRLGYDAVLYTDLFEGGEQAVQELFGCDITEAEGIGSGRTIDGDSVPIHATLRVLDPSRLHDVVSVPIAEVASTLWCY